MREKLLLLGGRTITIGSAGDFGPYPAAPFVALLPAFDLPERQAIEKMALDLASAGCIEFCCVGPEAELLHDALDWILSDIEIPGLITTGHDDWLDACEYFLSAGGGRIEQFIALISDHPELKSMLARTARDDGEPGAT